MAILDDIVEIESSSSSPDPDSDTEIEGARSRCRRSHAFNIQEQAAQARTFKYHPQSYSPLIIGSHKDQRPSCGANNCTNHTCIWTECRGILHQSIKHSTLSSTALSQTSSWAESCVQSTKTDGASLGWKADEGSHGRWDSWSTSNDSLGVRHWAASFCSQAAFRNW